MFLAITRRNAPHLSWLQGIVADTILALQFRCGNEFLNAVIAYDIAEMGIPEFGGSDAFLLFFYAPASLQCDSDSPF